MTLKVTLKNAPIKTFKTELNFGECYIVDSRAGSQYQNVRSHNNKATILVDDQKNGTLIMYTYNQDTIFQIIPPSCVIRNSDKDIKSILLNDDVPYVRCDGQRMEFDRDED